MASLFTPPNHPACHAKPGIVVRGLLQRLRWWSNLIAVPSSSTFSTMGFISLTTFWPFYSWQHIQRPIYASVKDAVTMMDQPCCKLGTEKSRQVIIDLKDAYCLISLQLHMITEWIAHSSTYLSTGAGGWLGCLKWAHLFMNKQVGLPIWLAPVYQVLHLWTHDPLLTHIVCSTDIPNHLLGAIHIYLSTGFFFQNSLPCIPSLPRLIYVLKSNHLSMYPSSTTLAYTMQNGICYKAVLYACRWALILYVWCWLHS